MESDGAHFACLRARAACLTLPRPKHDFWMGVLGLWVGTPSASQGTSLHKNSGPDAGSILNTVPLNIEYHSLCVAAGWDS
jgi:hypothetical protein